MAQTSPAYDTLKLRFAEVAHVKGAIAILGRDQQIVMPEGSAVDRMNQLVTLSSLAHRMINDPVLRGLLVQAESEQAALTAEDRRNLKLMRETLDNASMPEHLARELARLKSEGEQRHTRVRKSGTGDWSTMEDWYRHAFDTTRAVGRDKMNRMGFASIYEALLDNFSPGLKAAAVERELGKLEQVLPGMIREAQERQAKMPAPLPLKGPFPQEQQAELCRRVITAMGFDFTRGRVDFIPGHPSSGGTPDDTRFTIFCHPENFLDTLSTALHECGHGLYDQNRPAAWRYQPAGHHLGMAMHESQSRIMEMQAAMTPEFFEYLEREARAVFGRPHDPALSAENMMRLMQQVNPSFIRVSADELTYPAHVIVRHKLEKAIIEGTLDVKDLPAAWNDGMQKMLGITPPHNGKGCMQDVHWPTGSVGYFPAYTLGDMGAAQLFAAACKARPEIRGELKNGNFAPLREWLRDNVHTKGALLTYDEVFERATGEKLNADHYLDHLSRRYLGRPYTPSAPGTAPQAKL